MRSPTPALAARRERLVTGSSAAFDEVNGAAMIRDAFGGVRVTLIDSALVFDQVEPVLRYFDSTRSLTGLDAHDWARLRAALAEVIADRLRRGPWRVSKRVALLHATREADAQ